MNGNVQKMLDKYKEALPVEYFNQFRLDLLDFERSKSNRLLKIANSLRNNAKPRNRDFVVKQGNRVRTCIFNDNHKHVVRSGRINSKDLKMRWWCHDCKLWFCAYEYEEESKIAEEVRKQVEEERNKI